MPIIGKPEPSGNHYCLNSSLGREQTTNQIPTGHGRAIGAENPLYPGNVVTFVIYYR
jgi:hypothetical protein